MKALQRVLLRPVPDLDRTRRYQAVIDDYLDEVLADPHLHRGLLRTGGIDLPHETVPGYWHLDDGARATLTSEGAKAVYAHSAGRDGTAPLAVAAWAWQCPLSRYHRDGRLLKFFEAGLRFFCDSIRDDGVMGTFGLNGMIWAHGWDIEGLIYGLVWSGDALDTAVRDHAAARLQVTARHFHGQGRMGTHGNQGCVNALGLYLYGDFFDDAAMVAASDALWADLEDKVLDDSGQVIEQHGPCMHYSYTGFFYAWLNQFLRDDGRPEQAPHAARIANALRWFGHRSTASLYPLAGPSARMYYETQPSAAVDIVAACEQLAPTDGMLQCFADRTFAALPVDSNDGRRPHPIGATGHGASPLIWAMLACSGDFAPSHEQQRRWHEPYSQFFERMNLYGRSPLKYALVRRRYQTHFNFCDFLPFSGIQTWAWGDEPPLLHPTKLYPSTTRAWGLDTARQGVSHNWAEFGAGLMAADGYFWDSATDDNLTLLVARYDRLWRVVVFSDVATVQLEWGDYGRRSTSWTFNRNVKAVPTFDGQATTLPGGSGRLYSTLGPPSVEMMTPEDNGAAPVPVVSYECSGGLAAFALSDDSFSFGAVSQDECTIDFADSSGSYRITLSPNFFRDDTPGNMGYDPWRLVRETTARRHDVG